MSTQRHQRGQIFERHGAFHVRYYTTEIVDGQVTRKRVSHRLCSKDRNTGHGTAASKAVRQLCEDHMREVNAQTPTTPSTALTVVEFWQSTYLPFITANLKPSTVSGYTQVWEQHLKRHFGTLLLKDYKTPMGSLLLTNLAKKYRPRTLKHIKFLASGLFMHAVNTGNVEANPWRDVQVLGKQLPDGETAAYSLEEMQAVLNALVAHVDCQLMMALAFFLGLRKGEIQGLRWEDIKQDAVHVQTNVVRGVIGTLKGKKKLKVLPLITPVKVLLVLWRSKSTGTTWVFPNEAGNPVCLKDVAVRIIRPAIRRAGLTWKGYHAGRRGLGTTLRALTGNSNAGRDMLGHTDERVTQDHYEAEMPEEVLKGMKLLEAATAKGNQAQ
jgi:integrase